VFFFGFYDDQNVIAARDEYEEYLRISAQPCDKLLEWWKAYPLDGGALPLISVLALHGGQNTKTEM